MTNHLYAWLQWWYALSPDEKDDHYRQVALDRADREGYRVTGTDEKPNDNIDWWLSCGGCVHTVRTEPTPVFGEILR